MESYGYKPSLQFFHTPPSFSYTYITIYVMLAASPLLALAGLNVLGALLALAGIVFLVLEEELYIPVVTRIYGALWRRRSANIIADMGEGPETIVLTAHYDSTKAAFSFNPARVHSLRPTIKLNFISSVAVASLTLTGALLGSPLPLIVSVIASTPLIVSSLILVHREVFHGYVPGANDNASGVAVLLGVAEHLARDPGKVGGKARVLMVFTGAEEVGLLGSHYFYRGNWDMVRGAITINIDNPGVGSLAFTECEGVIMTWCSSGEFRKIIREFSLSKNIQVVTYKLLPTDVTPLMRRGLRASSLMAFADGMIANYHWYSDTADKVSSENLEKAKSIILDLLEALVRDSPVHG